MGGKAAKAKAPPASTEQAPASTQQAAAARDDVLVLCGPVVGKVTHNSANVLIEIDETILLTCQAVPREGGTPVKLEMKVEAGEPKCFALKGLAPMTAYDIKFSPLPIVQQRELEQRGCIVRTLAPPEELKRIRILGVSCDWCPWRLDEPKCKVVNPWKRVAELCKDGEVDVMCHLGDQVYTWENGCQLAAMRALDLCGMEGVSPELVHKMKQLGGRKLQEAYQATWSLDHTAQALAHSSHLMIWSDNDVTNDFTIARNKEGLQLWDKEYLSTAMRVYRMYQRALYDPDVITGQLALDHRDEVEEWHYHKYGQLGVFFIDMRGNRIRPDGEIKPKQAAPTDALPAVMSQKQRADMVAMFNDESLLCAIVIAEIPFAGEEPSGIKEKALKFPMLKDHWPYQMEELMFILDSCFKFKASKPGREVILLCGDIHVSVESTITEISSGIEIIQICTSPITNDVSRFRPALEGVIEGKYRYKHNAEPFVKQRTFAMIDIKFEDGKCTYTQKMECFDSEPPNAGKGDAPRPKPQVEKAPPAETEEWVESI